MPGATTASAASSFMKLVLVASIALAAYSVSSTERMSMTTRRSWLCVTGSYRAESARSCAGYRSRGGRRTATRSRPDMAQAKDRDCHG